MTVRNLLRIGAVATAAFLTVGASGNWIASVTKTDRGHLLGNPDAQVKLTEFVSYTCPHCATFSNRGEPALQIAYIAPGKLSFEIRPIIRNVVDLTATMMIQCGKTDKFRRNHTMFMINQTTWLSIARNASRSQQIRWTVKNRATARRSIASDLGFYGMMETRGYSRPALDHCLADEAEAKRLEANTDADFDEFGIKGTPSFAINGEVLEGVSSWRALEPVLNAHF